MRVVLLRNPPWTQVVCFRISFAYSRPFDRIAGRQHPEHACNIARCETMRKKEKERKKKGERERESLSEFSERKSRLRSLLRPRSKRGFAKRKREKVPLFRGGRRGRSPRGPATFFAIDAADKLRVRARGQCPESVINELFSCRTCPGR